MADESKKEDQDLSVVRDHPEKGRKLSCGSRVCLHCHSQCGVVMVAYLSGLDEGPEKNENEEES
jgi:hypothetical protein